MSTKENIMSTTRKMKAIDWRERVQPVQGPLAAVFCAAVLTFVSALDVHGAIIGAGYQVTFSSSDRVLSAMGTSMEQQIINDEMCDSPHLRIRARNKPAIKLTNTSNAASTAPLSSFTIDIKSGEYSFGSGDTAFDVFQHFVRVSPFSDNTVQVTGGSLSNGGKSLTVNFSGLTAGKSVIFNVDLDAMDSAMFPFPDFRAVLFGAPMGFNASATTPAKTTARFVDVSGNPPAFQDVSKNLQQITTPPLYANAAIRPYHAPDPIDILTTGADAPIPEPSAGVISLIALLSATSLRYRS